MDSVMAGVLVDVRYAVKQLRQFGDVQRALDALERVEEVLEQARAAAEPHDCLHCGEPVREPGMPVCRECLEGGVRMDGTLPDDGVDLAALQAEVDGRAEL